MKYNDNNIYLVQSWNCTPIHMWFVWWHPPVWVLKSMWDDVMNGMQAIRQCKTGFGDERGAG
jgi:hypothetical protein